MPTTGNHEESAPKTCQECSRWQEIRHKLKIAESLEKTINSIEARLTSNEFKPTIGDYAKLLQMQKDFEDETPKEITVTWVEPSPEK